MIEVSIPLVQLKAIRLLAAKKDVRTYLMMVALSEGHIVATDGAACAAYRNVNLDGAPEVLIPVSTIDAYAKKARAFPGVHDVTVRWEEKKQEGAFTRNGWLTNGTAEEKFQIEDWVYPHWKRIMVHHTEARGCPQFNWDYLALFNRVAETLGLPKGVTYKSFLVPNGARGVARVLIHSHPDFEGALAPIDWKDAAPVPAVDKTNSAEGLV